MWCVVCGVWFVDIEDYSVAIDTILLLLRTVVVEHTPECHILSSKQDAAALQTAAAWYDGGGGSGGITQQCLPRML